MYSVVLVLIEKIYQTLETVFQRPPKQLEFCQKYSAARRELSYRFCPPGVFANHDETLSLVFDILLQVSLFFTKELVFLMFRDKQRSKTLMFFLSKNTLLGFMLYIISVVTGQNKIFPVSQRAIKILA